MSGNHRGSTGGSTVRDRLVARYADNVYRELSRRRNNSPDTGCAVGIFNQSTSTRGRIALVD